MGDSLVLPRKPEHVTTEGTGCLTMWSSGLSGKPGRKVPDPAASEAPPLVILRSSPRPLCLQLLIGRIKSSPSDLQIPVRLPC